MFTRLHLEWDGRMGEEEVRGAEGGRKSASTSGPLERGSKPSPQVKVSHQESFSCTSTLMMSDSTPPTQSSASSDNYCLSLLTSILGRELVLSLQPAVIEILSKLSIYPQAELSFFKLVDLNTTFFKNPFTMFWMSSHASRIWLSEWLHRDGQSYVLVGMVGEDFPGRACSQIVRCNTNTSLPANTDLGLSRVCGAGQPLTIPPRSCPAPQNLGLFRTMGGLSIFLEMDYNKMESLLMECFFSPHPLQVPLPLRHPPRHRSEQVSAGAFTKAFSFLIFIPN